MATAECVLYADEVAETFGEGWLVKVNGSGVGSVRYPTHARNIQLPNYVDRKARNLLLTIDPYALLVRRLSWSRARLHKVGST